MAALDGIADVDIDANGRFKYILIRVSNSGTEKFIVRGFQWAEYHADIYENEEEKLKNEAVQLDCVGGGRILHEAEKKHILVYGYSQGFGRADHTIAVNLLKTKYTDYSIEFSNEGY